MTDIEAFIRGLPKVELHIHVEGSFEPSLMFEMARRNGVDLPYDSVEALRTAYRFIQLQDFLDLYYQGLAPLNRAEDFHDLCIAYLRRAHEDRVMRAEIFFDAQGHTLRGVPLEAVMEGLLSALDEGEREYDGIKSGLILCFLRHLDEESALRTFEAARPWFDRILGVGLDSSELGNPPAKFARVFERARGEGLRVVAHAGEEGPPDFVREALDVLQVERIDHGVRAMEDPELVARLAREGTPLTVCPLSNIRLAVVDDLARHPLKRMLEAGLCATVNSDDPAYFGGYMTDNFLAVHEALRLDKRDIVRLARNAIAASFAPASEKSAMGDRLEAYLATAD